MMTTRSGHFGARKQTGGRHYKSFFWNLPVKNIQTKTEQNKTFGENLFLRPTLKNEIG